MTRIQAIDSLTAKLDSLTEDQLVALADMAEAYAREVPPEDDATRAAIAEGVAQAKAGQRVSQADTDALLKTTWR